MNVPVFPLFGLSRLRMGSDGQGVTTLVAAKGCPLRCKWCCNPESQSFEIQEMETGGKTYHQEFEVTVLNYVETNYKEGSLSELAELIHPVSVHETRRVLFRIIKTARTGIDSAHNISNIFLKVFGQ